VHHKNKIPGPTKSLEQNLRLSKVPEIAAGLAENMQKSRELSILTHATQQKKVSHPKLEKMR